MTSWRFAELESDADRLAAAADAVLWGFPREVNPVEVASGFWFRMGQSVVFWFEEQPGGLSLAPLHLAVAPEARGRWPVRTWWIVAQAIAEILGADAVSIATFPEDCKTPEYLSRLGMELHPSGVWVKQLGGRVSWGSSSTLPTIP